MSTKKQEEQIVAELSEMMSKKLRDNRGKGWSSDLVSMTMLLRLMKAEIQELEESIMDGHHKDARIECADIANYAAMIADRLKEREG